MVHIDEKAINGIGAVLNDPNRPMKERFRALFTLKNIKGELAIKHISECFKDDSALLKHELAYCLGQMQDKNAIPILSQVLEDTSQEPMVRHEAGEALGAIGDFSVLELLEKYEKDPVVEVAETCQLAVRRLKWVQDGKKLDENVPENPYLSVDPTPPSDILDVEELGRILVDENRPLYERYQAMFSLRNLGTTASIDALGKGLEAPSALFRHEVAFVFGQMQDPRSVQYLKRSLQNPDENEMVRHEAAEALGAIATDECQEVLQRYLKDSKRVVRESCEVALDMSEYENSPEFQYANTLVQVGIH